MTFKDKNSTDKRMGVIYLNPYQSWKGKVADRKKKIATFNPDQLNMFDDHGKRPLLRKNFSEIQENSTTEE